MHAKHMMSIKNVLRKEVTMNKAGIYIATDIATQVDYLIHVTGEVPYLKIISAINYSAFKNTGEVTAYKAKGTVISKIEANPMEYEFKKLTITPRIEIALNTENEDTIVSTDPLLTFDESEEYLEYYRENACNEARLTSYIMFCKSIKTAEAKLIVKFIVKKARNGNQ